MYCVDVVAFALTLGYCVGRLRVLPPVLAKGWRQSVVIRNEGKMNPADGMTDHLVVFKGLGEFGFVFVVADHELFNFSIDFSDDMIFVVKFVQEHLQVGMHRFSFLQGFGCGGDDTGSGASNGVALTA